MEQLRFMFWEILKIVAFTFASLLAAKAIASLKATVDGSLARRLVRAKPW